MKHIYVFTDGAAKGNPGPGGFGIVILKGTHVTERGGGKSHTTNNEMELTAVVEALSYIGVTKHTIHIYSDSKYVVEGAQHWIYGWVKNGWKTKSGGDVLNQILWQKFFDLQKNSTIEWHKIPGHSGIIGNERADTIASCFGNKTPISLFDGRRSIYPYDIENTSFDSVKVQKRSDARTRSSQKAHSYVSMLDGIVMVHETWSECEKRVKGKKNVRFKKACTAEEEKNIIRIFRG
jgi:ribonuclease HI